MAWIEGAILSRRMGITPEPETEKLTYNSRANGDQLISEVVDEDGRTLIVSSYRGGEDTMRVTDLRDGSVANLKISLGQTLEEVTEDMREAGYLTDNQELVIGEVDTVRWI